MVHHCNIYIGKGNYAVRHRKKMDKSFPPSGNLRAGPDPKGQSPVAGEKVTEGSKDPGKGLGLQRALP